MIQFEFTVEGRTTKEQLDTILEQEYGVKPFLRLAKMGIYQQAVNIPEDRASEAFEKFLFWQREGFIQHQATFSVLY